MARMAHRLWWGAQVMAWLGLLDRKGVAARWIAEQVAQLEHGLRCLLVIAAPRGVANARYTAKASRGRDPVHDESLLAAPDLPADLGTGPGMCRRRFSVSLTAFVEPDQQPPPLGHVGKVPDDGERLSKADDAGISPEHDLFDRLNAMSVVFADPDACALRMARQIARRGWRLRSLIVRPGALRVRAPDAIMPHAPEVATAFADTS